MKINLLVTNEGYIHNGGNISRSHNFRLFQTHGMFGADSCMTRDIKNMLYLLIPTLTFLRQKYQGKILKKASCLSPSHRSHFNGLMSKSDKQHVNKMYSAHGTLKHYFYSYLSSSGLKYYLHY